MGIKEGDPFWRTLSKEGRGIFDDREGEKKCGRFFSDRGFFTVLERREAGLFSGRRSKKGREAGLCFFDGLFIDDL